MLHSIKIAMSLCLLLSLSLYLGLVTGEGDLGDHQLRGMFLKLRLCRIVVAFGIGASLSVAGVLVQGFLHNPLASPSIIGTTGGASLGGKLVMLLVPSSGSTLFGLTLPPEAVVPLGCLAGAMGALLLLMAMTRQGDSTVKLLLTGFLISSISVSLGALMTALAQESWDLGRSVIAFTLGGVSGSGYRQALMISIFAFSGTLAVWRCSDMRCVIRRL